MDIHAHIAKRVINKKSSMRRSKMISLNQQGGHAGILFALMIPVLFGVFALGTDGSRAIQTKARLQDGLEVAALAVAARNDTNESAGEDPTSVNKKIVTNFVMQYVPEATSVKNIKVKKITCEQNDACNQDNNSQRFTQYSASANITQDSWFPGSGNVIGFDDNYDVSGNSQARKYQSEAVDVMFAADFSGSMSDYWDGGNKRKYLDLIDIIGEVTDELKKFNDINPSFHNRVGIVPYNFITNTAKNLDYSNLCYRDFLYYNYGYPDDINSGWYLDTNTTVSNVFSNVIVGSLNNNVWDVKNYYYWGGNYYSWNKNNKNVNVRNKCNNRVYFTSNNSYRVDTSAKFRNIPLTDDFPTFKTNISSFKPNWGTSSYTGIINAAMLLKDVDTPNPRRILIVISDGDDSNKNITKGLVDGGLCTHILSELNSDKGINNKLVKSKLAVIGFDYNPNDNEGLRDCVGVDNVYPATNRQQILDRILELITEEIGHLY